MTNEERGRRLAEARTRMGRSQRWVAKQALVSDRTVWRAEQGQPLADESLVAICLVLELDPQELRTPDGEEVPAEASGVFGDHDAEDAVELAPVPPRPTRKSISDRVFVAGLGVAALVFVAGIGGGAELMLEAMASPIERRYDAQERAVGASLFFADQIAGAARDVVDGNPDAAVVRVGNRIRAVRTGGAWCPTCETEPTANSVSRTPYGLQITIGPILGRDFGSSIVRGLSRSPSLRVLATSSNTPVEPSPGRLWADPRGLLDGEFPGGRDGPYVFIRIEKEPRP